MAIRRYAVTEVRKGGSMSKGPDLSAFPIPRKGGAKPISTDEAAEVAADEPLKVAEPASVSFQAPPTLPPSTPLPDKEPPPPALRSSGQTVATTVKLDESRYLRLADAGRPGPGRLKRRTIQEMVIEALDEWFERRGL